MKNLLLLLALPNHFFVVFLTRERYNTLSAEHQAFVWADEQKCREVLPKEIVDDFEKNKIFEKLLDR